MNAILNNNSRCLNVAPEVGSLADLGPLVGLDAAPSDAEDYYLLRFDFSSQRSIPADSEFVIGQLDATLDITIQV